MRPDSTEPVIPAACQHRDVLARVVLVHAAEDHGDALAHQRVVRNAGVVEGVGDDFHRVALVGLHRDDVARREPEHERIEALRVIEEACELRRDLARRAGPRVVDLVDVEPELDAMRRRLADSAAALAQHAPERFRAAVAAWEAQADADDRDRLRSARNQTRSQIK
jgi:hypothetical protein